ncbi:MAG TPA: DUF2235 domain-containing protein, partial [Micavibrio sp.]
NTNASRMIENICHIVAVDERRTAYAPTLFSNLDELNRDHGKESGDPDAPFKEVWAPGNHGSVGGGGDIVGLSHTALLYMCADMARLGVRFNQAALDSIRAQADVGVSLDNESKGTLGLMGQVLLAQGDRVGPSALHQVAPSTFARWQRVPAYRNNPVLAKVAAALDRYPG